ncbi:MAG: hypothetical protein KDA16_00445 [Phycisphaerales bacterium]|nr:hypothetical protein [Phycisphaerales bacterium]
MTQEPDPLSMKAIMQKSQEYTQVLQFVTNLVKALWFLLLHMFSVPIEVFFRWRFGERHLTLMSIVSGALILGVMTKLFKPGPYDNRPESVAGYFAIAFFFVIVAHAAEMSYRRKKHILWHSRSPGLSIIPWHKIPGFSYESPVWRLIEPAAIFALGYWIATRRHDPFGWYLVGGSVAMWFKTEIIYSAKYNKVLDLQDQRIEADIANQAIIEPKSPRELRGYVMPGGARWNVSQHSNIQ